MRRLLALAVAIYALSSIVPQDAFASGPYAVYVDTYEGNDASACTQSAPCKTIAAGLVAVGSQTHLLVVDGVRHMCSNGTCSF